MTRRNERPNGDADLLRIRDDDEPLVVQMKLLRHDLIEDQRSRRRFERNIRFWVAVVGIFSVLSTWSWWSTRASDRDAARRADARACEVRREGREGARSGIIAAGVQSAETLIEVIGAQDDPRALRLLEQIDDDLAEVLDDLLPPVVCS